MSSPDYRFETLQIHAGQSPAPGTVEIILDQRPILGCDSEALLPRADRLFLRDPAGNRIEIAEKFTIRENDF